MFIKENLKNFQAIILSKLDQFFFCVFLTIFTSTCACPMVLCYLKLTNYLEYIPHCTRWELASPINIFQIIWKLLAVHQLAYKNPLQLDLARLWAILVIMETSYSVRLYSFVGHFIKAWTFFNVQFIGRQTDFAKVV